MLGLGCKCVKNTFYFMRFTAEMVTLGFVRPGLSHFFHGLNEHVSLYWLGYIIIATRLRATLAVAPHGVVSN